MTDETCHCGEDGYIPCWELKAEIEKLKSQQQDDVDAIVHYRNLAIALGTTPDEMLTPYDRKLAETKDGIDRVDYDRHAWWQEVYGLEDELERLKGFARAVIGDPDVDLAELDAEMGAKVLEQWTIDWDDAGKAEVLKDHLAEAVALLKKWEVEIQPHPSSIDGQAFRALLKYDRKE